MTAIVVIYVIVSIIVSFIKISFEKKIQHYVILIYLVPSQLSMISIASFGEDVLEKYKDTLSDDAT